MDVAVADETQEGSTGRGRLEDGVVSTSTHSAILHLASATGHCGGSHCLLVTGASGDILYEVWRRTPNQNNRIKAGVLFPSDHTSKNSKDTKGG